jgi:hypothetical protein
MAPRAACLLALALALAAPPRGDALTWKTCGALHARTPKIIPT